MDDWKGAPLRQILWAELIPYGQSERITFEGPQVDLPSKYALALTLYELAINAAKYGALSKNGGTLMVKWSVKMDGAGRELSFEWNENLDELLPSRRVTESFGVKLIKNAITHDLRGTCAHTLATGGVCVSKPYSAASLQKGLITVLQQKDGQHPGAASASELTLKMRPYGRARPYGV